MTGSISTSPPRPARTSWTALALAASLGLLVAGCRTVSFYQQAVSGHSAIVLKKRPIEDVVADPRTPDTVRGKLALILELRVFAEEELLLPAKGQFLHYAEIDRPYVVWDIYAAPEFSLEPKSWWYPFVGSLSYRGYFDERQARSDARRLQGRGYDVFVAGIDAYSTLGWFQDPVLSTFIDRDEADLADLVFHELAHQKLFLEGDTDFNEAFATAVAREGVRRWFQRKAGTDTLSQWERRIRREEQFIALILASRRRLEELYAQAGAHAPLDPDRAQRLRRDKAGVFHQLRLDFLALKEHSRQLEEFDIWFDYPLNNARLNAEATYYEWIPAFEQLLRESSDHLPHFYKSVEDLGNLDEPERKSMLEALHDRAPSRTIPDLAGDLCP